MTAGIHKEIPERKSKPFRKRGILRQNGKISLFIFCILNSWKHIRIVLYFFTVILHCHIVA